MHGAALLDGRVVDVADVALAPAQFAVGAATGQGPQIVYNAVTGALFYDSNGASAGGSTQFAVLTGAPTLTNQDFLIV